MFQAKILADSEARFSMRNGAQSYRRRLTTWLLTYPRFIHAEFMTHRVFSRNAASSRAIPSSTLIRAVRENPAGPVSWGSNQKGMQAGEQIPLHLITRARKRWESAADEAADHAEAFNGWSLHKQVANRVLEPFTWMTVIASATEVENFFALRASPMAQPEFQLLAYLMLDSYLKSTPRQMEFGSWHLPLMSEEETNQAELSVLGHTGNSRTLRENEILRVCAARCARVSYTKHDREHTREDDLRLADSLITNGHWSPLEHAAMATMDNSRYGNFIGFRQFRKAFEKENVSGADMIDLQEVMDNAPAWVRQRLPS